MNTLRSSSTGSSAAAGGRSTSQFPGGIVILAVWAMVAAMGLALAVTYAWVPVAELYHVSKTGLAGGAGRLLVYLNYPAAFIAIGLVGFAAVRLWSSPIASNIAGRIAIVVAAIIAVALCAVAGLPGVVDQGDLDARLINAIPALGVAIAVAMTVVSIRVSGLGTDAPWSPADRIRLVATAIVVFLSLPWLFAYIGVYVGDIPGLGWIFMSRQVPEGETLAAVHLGDHHGMSGATFLLAGIWLSREIRNIGPAVFHWIIASFVSLMMAYGLFNAAQDFWLEQIVKRGWFTVEIPNVTRPAISFTWGLMLLTTVALAAYFIWNSRPERVGPVDEYGHVSRETHQAEVDEIQREHAKGSRQVIH
jgi:hypothetical protein